MNSSKSNDLPSNLYFDRFVSLQHLGLITTYQHLKERQQMPNWNNYIESYLSNLNVTIEDILDEAKLKKAY